MQKSCIRNLTRNKFVERGVASRQRRLSEYYIQSDPRHMQMYQMYGSFGVSVHSAKKLHPKPGKKARLVREGWRQGSEGYLNATFSLISGDAHTY